MIREGYFNIINGYKAPFVSGKDALGNKIYLPGTSIEQLYKVKRFDDELRLFLLRYITHVEEEMRTLTGYKFDQCNNDGKITWYDANAYSGACTLQEHMGAISSAYSELSKSQLDYVKFYMKNHTQIPTWIMIKVVNFSTFINVLKCSKTDVTHSQPSGRIKDKYILALRKSYQRESGKLLFDLLLYFKYYLPNNEYQEMMSELQNLFEVLQESIAANAFHNIRGSMGIKDLADLEILKKLSKDEIEYNKFDARDYHLK